MAKKQTKKRSRSSILADIKSVHENLTNPVSTTATAMFSESVMPSPQAELMSRLLDELTALGPDPTFLAGWQAAIDADQAALDEAEMPDAVRYSLATVLCDSRNHLQSLEAAVTAESLDAAVSAAYDLGQSRQRFTLQFSFEPAVDAGTRSKSRSTNANAAKSKRVPDKIEAAFAEFTRRMGSTTGTRKTNQTLVAMSEVMNPNTKPPKPPKPLWGSIATLNRYAKLWNSITPSE